MDPKDAGAASGYIKLHRKITSWGWYTDTNTKVVFLHLLLTATWTGGEYKGHKLNPGDVVIGRKALAAQTGLTEQQIRTSLQKLEQTGEITKKATNRFTVVSIANWGLYQLEEENITNNQPTDNQQITNKQPHYKKVRKKERKNTPPKPPSRGATGPKVRKEDEPF